MTSKVAPRLPLQVACHTNIFAMDASPETFSNTVSGIQQTGFSHVVLPPFDLKTVSLDSLTSVMTARGIKPVVMVGGCTPETDLGSSDASIRRAGDQRLRSFVDFTRSIGGTQMNGVPYGPFGRPAGQTSKETFALAAKGVGEVANYAHDQGITMTFEVLNRYETSLVNTAEQALEFVALSGSEHLKIHLDTFHMAIEEADMGKAITMALPKLGYLELGQSGRGMLSQGVVDIASIVSFALDSGYTGLFGLEGFSRAILNPRVSDALAVWLEPFFDGNVVATDAANVIRRGYEQSDLNQASS